MGKQGQAYPPLHKSGCCRLIKLISTKFDDTELLLSRAGMPSWEEQMTECGRFVRVRVQAGTRLGLHLRSSWECCEDTV